MLTADAARRGGAGRRGRLLRVRVQVGARVQVRVRVRVRRRIGLAVIPHRARLGECEERRVGGVLVRGKDRVRGRGKDRVEIGLAIG